MCKIWKGGIETMAITESFGEFRWEHCTFYVYELLLFVPIETWYWFGFTQHLNFYIVPFLYSGLGKHSLHILYAFLPRFLFSASIYSYTIVNRVAMLCSGPKSSSEIVWYFKWKVFYFEEIELHVNGPSGMISDMFYNRNQ